MRISICESIYIKFTVIVLHVRRHHQTTIPKKKKKKHPSSMLKEPPVLPALMVKVLHSQSVSVDDLPSFSKGSPEMLSDIRN